MIENQYVRCALTINLFTMLGLAPENVIQSANIEIPNVELSNIELSNVESY
jgi:hypothetical protein